MEHCGRRPECIYATRVGTKKGFGKCWRVVALCFFSCCSVLSYWGYGDPVERGCGVSVGGTRTGFSQPRQQTVHLHDVSVVQKLVILKGQDRNLIKELNFSISY